ncbi:MAG TPA: hypothetical protein VL091_05920, partial [Marinobacter sp.]|nr:hypothetical protein [Marinobacter sp.]
MKSLPERIKTSAVRPSDLQGLSRLVIDAITGVTGVVESVHYTVLHMQVTSKTPVLPGGGLRFIYRSITQVTRVTGVVLDTLLEALVPLVESGKSSFARDTVLAAINGVLGDYLESSGSPLAIPMTFRKHGQPVELKQTSLAAAYPRATQKVMVLAHGLCMSDLQWGRDETQTESETGTQGTEEAIRYARMAEALGYTPLFLHYNSGRHISTNGREFSSLLDTLVQEWPVPITELVVVGHSMGGL